MIDPSASALLDAVADTLERQVVPTTDGGARHSARVASNLCRIVAREIRSPSDPSTPVEIGRLLDLPDDVGPDEVWAALDEALKSGDSDLAEASLPLVRMVVEHELSISKPSYLHDSR